MTMCLRHISTGHAFHFVSGDYDNTVGVLMKSKGWTHQDVTWLVDDYYAVTWDENLEHWNLDSIAGRGEPDWPRPVRIEGFGYIRPQPVHICSATASQYIHVIEYRAIWADGLRDHESFDAFDDHWYDELLLVDDLDGSYENYDAVIDECGRPRRERFTAVSGPFYFSHDDYETEQDREYAMIELCLTNPPL